MNTFIVMALACNLVNLIYYMADGMMKSAAIEGSGIIMLFVFMICNLKGFFDAPKLLSIILVNCHSFCLCYVQGTNQGAYLYLFPFVMAMIFFLRVRKNDLAVTLFIIGTTINLLVIVFLFPYHSTAEPVTEAVGTHHLVLNIIINFLLVVTFFYFVLKLLDAKEKRNKSEKKFTDTILNTSLDAVFVVDPVFLQIRQYNDKAAELFTLGAFDKKNKTYPVTEVLGEKLANRIIEIKDDPSHPDNWQGDISFVRHNKPSFHGFVSIVSFEYSEQRFIKISILDITTIKLAEFETLQAKGKAEKAAAAKARFMSNMSHELRTPLNAIIGTTHLLIQDHELLQHTEHFKVLKNSSEHMLHLVNEVLDFSKLDEGKLEFINEPFDLTNSLRQVTDSFASVIKQKEIQLVTEIDSLPGGAKVIGDEMRLRQVFLNLLSNAVKFTETGSVTLQVNIKKLAQASAEIYFEVSDTGIGIAPDKFHLIFDSFTQADAETTRKYGGSGLGLTICRELVKKMGGDLQVASQPEKGSRFYFTLPLPFQQQQATVAPEEKLWGLKKLTGIKILLAEDNAVNRKIAIRFLNSWGASIDTAENGQIAWELFQQQSYDLLLIDLEMPLMDGKQLLAEIRNINKEIPAIAFTAAVYENMYDDLQRHGFNSYLHKPFRPDEMHRNILQQLTAGNG
jgi:signal transduction histidine kinase/CheY-like chemotaxis protein